ncbi:hypothetical protein [Dickeya sp. ws52]|uniref:hypothetical protein n=1 Tax=Dickeya sp. ws52 TaxID=2576377 RepID=UPI00351B301C
MIPFGVSPSMPSSALQCGLTRSCWPHHSSQRSARFQAVSLQGAWLTDGMPLKIRVMPGCMVITAQNTRELWHCLEGLSIEPFDPDAAANWIKHYPGGLKFAE